MSNSIYYSITIYSNGKLTFISHKIKILLQNIHANMKELNTVENDVEFEFIEKGIFRIHTTKICMGDAKSEYKLH